MIYLLNVWLKPCPKWFLIGNQREYTTTCVRNFLISRDTSRVLDRICFGAQKFGIGQTGYKIWSQKAYCFIVPPTPNSSLCPRSIGSFGGVWDGDGDVGDSPGGPFKQPGKPHLKPAKKTKVNHASLKHTGHGPRHGGPDGPPRRPTQKSLWAGSASLEGTRLPRVRSAPFEGGRLPRASSASLEGPHRPRVGSASLEGAPHAHARSRTRVRAFNALTTAGRRHHAPGTRAPVLLYQLHRREPIPATVGDCATWSVPVPWRRAAYSCTANAPSPRRGAGRTLDLISRDFAGLGQGVRSAGRHPCHC
jgi:hypothetical protein